MTALATDLIAELRAIVGASHVLADPDVKATYERDITGRYAGTAALVLRPADTLEVSRVLAACSLAGAPVVVQGGNTGLSGGGVPVDGEIVLSMQRLQQIGPIDPLSAQVSVGAGVTLEAVQRHARQAGMRFLVDHGARSAATIGGMVATNAGGPLALRHGTMRSQVTGLEVVLGDGRVLRRMSGLLKDNAGYDYVPMLVGSEGTLAAVTAARLQLGRDPRERLTVLVGLASMTAAVELVSGLRQQLGSLEAADFFTDEGMELVCAHRRLTRPFAERHDTYVVLELADDVDPTEALHEALLPLEALAQDVAAATDTARREALWRYRESHNEVINATGVPVKLDISVAPLDVPRFADELRSLVAASWPAAQLILYGHLGDGNVHVNVLGLEGGEQVEDAVLGLVGAFGGSINAEHGMGRTKVAWLHHSRSELDIELMQSLKRTFDPEGILGSGRVIPPAP